MKFLTLAQTFEKLEETASQNEMVDILADIFTKASEEEISTICYYCVGQIYPGYKETTMGMGEKMTQSAIALACDTSEKEVDTKIKELGDLGDVAQDMEPVTENQFSEYFTMVNSLTVNDVDKGLKKIAKAQGSGSQEVKKKTLAALLIERDPIERKYIARLANGTMRTGAGDMTVLDGLSMSFFGTKDKRPELEHAYNVCSDIGYVAEVLKRSGMSGVKRIRIKLNRPLRPMLAQRVSKIQDIQEKISSDTISTEEKYDGERVQAHKDRDAVTLFSRRLSNVTEQFPEIVEHVKTHITAEKAILDGEAVAYDFEKEQFVEFQKLMRRRRKYDIEEYAEKVPVKYMVFDVLYVNGSSLMRKKYSERRETLEDIVKDSTYIGVTHRKVSKTLGDIENFFHTCLDKNLEGIICKSCGKDSYYRAGAREWSWIKWKKSYVSELSDTLDLVVVGAYAGRGKRSSTYGALLCTAYNHEKDVYQTVCKVGTGFTDKQLEELPEKLGPVKVENKPARVDATDDVEPDFWFTPDKVIEVGGAEITRSPVHSCARKKGKGLALRFPRMKKWRPQKSSEQATTAEEIIDMYENQ